jgi:hypothetical protein
MVYVFLSIIGTVFPYYFFIPFVSKHGLDVPLLLDLLFTNSISTFFAVDFILSCIVFIFFLFSESNKYQIKEKWICLFSLCVVGLSLALPLFLFFRHPHVTKYQ